jgi:hypothetical protein
VSGVPLWTASWRSVDESSPCRPGFVSGPQPAEAVAPSEISRTQLLQSARREARGARREARGALMFGVIPCSLCGLSSSYGGYTASSQGQGWRCGAGLRRVLRCGVGGW